MFLKLGTLIMEYQQIQLPPGALVYWCHVYISEFLLYQSSPPLLVNSTLPITPMITTQMPINRVHSSRLHRKGGHIRVDVAGFTFFSDIKDRFPVIMNNLLSVG